MANLYKCFVDNDCSMLEINPLILTADDHVLALDAKVDFDSNALFPAQGPFGTAGTLPKRILWRWRPASSTSTTSTWTATWAISSTSAGLAMATMDIN